MDYAPILEILLRWRITLSLVGSIAAALVLSRFLEWFAVGHGLSVVIVGLAFGVLWAGRAEDGGKPIPTPQLSRPVTFLELSLFGVIAGGLVAGVVGGTVVATLLLAISAAAVAIRKAVVEHKKTSAGEIVFRTIALLSGWAIVLILLGSKWITDL